MQYDTLRFDTEQIATIARGTLGHRQQWDAIWNTVRARLSATAAEALSAQPGGSLEQRTADYHRRTQRYNQCLLAQAAAVASVGRTATACNQQMARILAG